jgi:hypothetical protein
MKYERMRAAGKPAKITVMRNLIEIENACVKADSKSAPKLA